MKTLRDNPIGHLYITKLGKHFNDYWFTIIEPNNHDYESFINAIENLDEEIKSNAIDDDVCAIFDLRYPSEDLQMKYLEKNFCFNNYLRLTTNFGYKSKDFYERVHHHPYNKVNDGPNSVYLYVDSLNNDFINQFNNILRSRFRFNVYEFLTYELYPEAQSKEIQEIIVKQYPPYSHFLKDTYKNIDLEEILFEQGDEFIRGLINPSEHIIIKVLEHNWNIETYNWAKTKNYNFSDWFQKQINRLKLTYGHLT